MMLILAIGFVAFFTILVQLAKIEKQRAIARRK